jgi:hypothetical protein
MTRSSIAVLAALVAAFFMPGRPGAEAACAPRDRVVGQLAQRYHEVRVAAGVSAAGSLVEVFVAEHGTTWTIAVTTPNGLTCLVASGEGWREVEPKGPET